MAAAHNQARWGPQPPDSRGQPRPADQRPAPGAERAGPACADCCYSVSNIALIVASLVAAFMAAKFLTDDPLFEYGEHLLTLRFYRQLIYILVVLALVLLVPLANTLLAFLLAGAKAKWRHRPHDARPEPPDGYRLWLVLRLAYQLLLALLVLVGLFCVGGNARFGPVLAQVSLELRKHIERRYRDDFSYVFLDRLQEEYECCDAAWYGAGEAQARLPLSCFQPDGSFRFLQPLSCAETLAALVSNRCLAMAASLLLLLAALAALAALDALELASLRARARGYYLAPGGGVAAQGRGRPESPGSCVGEQPLDEPRPARHDAAWGPDRSAAQTNNNHSNNININHGDPVNELEHERQLAGALVAAEQARADAPVLARARYAYTRTPTPTTGPGGSQASAGSGGRKSSLRRSTSSSLNRADGECTWPPEGAGSNRSAAHRRSLLNVRFADELEVAEGPQWEPGSGQQLLPQYLARE